jgi:Polysaccharide deacetylase/Glycosyl transferase family 2
MTTGWIAGQRDDLAVGRPGPMLSWGQLLEVAERGVEIGAHSHTHPELDTLVPGVLEREVVRPKRLLEERLGREVTSFAYPHGYVNARLRRSVRTAGYRSACAVRNLPSHPGDDPFFLSRQTMGPSTGLEAFRRILTAPFSPPSLLRAQVLPRGWRMVRRSRPLLRRGGLAGRPDDRLRPRPAAGRGGRGAAVGGRARGRARWDPLPPGAGPGAAARAPPGHGRPRPRRGLAGSGDPGRAGLGVADEVIRDHLAADGAAPPAQFPIGGLGDGPCRATLPLDRAPLASVVVATRDRPEEAVACVEGLLALAYPSYEILLVDNAPASEATAVAVGRRFGHLPRVRYLREDRPGLSNARNRGLAEAAGEVVASEDVLVDPGGWPTWWPPSAQPRTSPAPLA